jgi:hypothetical protein
MNNNFIHHTPNSKEEIFSWKSLLSQLSLESINKYFEDYKTSCLYYQTNAKRIKQAVDSLFEVKYQNHFFRRISNIAFCRTLDPQTFRIIFLEYAD